jgi:hypothetical protein
MMSNLYEAVNAHHDDVMPVAIAYNRDGSVMDECFTWELGELYSREQGIHVVAIIDDDGISKAEMQRMFDAGRRTFQASKGHKR